MKDQLLKLNELLTRLSPDLFYVICIYHDHVTLQGKFHSTTIVALKRIGFPNDSFIISEPSNYITASFDNIKVTLSE